MLTIFLSERASSPTVCPLRQQRFLNTASATTNLSLDEEILMMSSARTAGDMSAVGKDWNDLQETQVDLQVGMIEKNGEAASCLLV